MDKISLLKSLMWKDFVNNNMDNNNNKESCEKCNISKSVCPCAWNAFNPTSQEMDEYNKKYVEQLKKDEQILMEEIKLASNELLKLHHLQQTLESSPKLPYEEICGFKLPP